MKEQFAIVTWDDLSRLRHSLSNDMLSIAKLWMQLKRCLEPDIAYGLQQTIISDTVDDIKDFHLNRMEKTMDILN